MGGVHITVLGDAHSYTRSRAPWRIDAGADSEAAKAARGKKFGWRLFHYISGGGMKSFGRTIEQEEADMRRGRFLWASAALGAAWLWFWI